MASTAATSLSGATKLGDLYDAINRLKASADELFSAYENDDSAYGLANLSNGIATQASNLESALNGVGSALQNLGS